jgi:hypothetical protein
MNYHCKEGAKKCTCLQEVRRCTHRVTIITEESPTYGIPRLWIPHPLASRHVFGSSCKVPLLLSDFNQNWNVSTKLLELLNTKFNRYLFSHYPVVTSCECRSTDGQSSFNRHSAELRTRQKRGEKILP